MSADRCDRDYAQITPRVSGHVVSFRGLGGHDIRRGEDDRIQGCGFQSLPTDTGVKTKKRSLSLNLGFVIVFPLNFGMKTKKIGFRHDVHSFFRPRTKLCSSLWGAMWHFGGAQAPKRTPVALGLLLSWVCYLSLLLPRNAILAWGSTSSDLGARLQMPPPPWRKACIQYSNCSRDAGRRVPPSRLSVLRSTFSVSPSRFKRLPIEILRLQHQQKDYWTFRQKSDG